MTKNSGISIDSNLFDWPSNKPHLKGSQCSDCEAVTFPIQDGCPRCCGTNMRQIPLKTQGTLWSWTVQGFLPKSPPYAGQETLENFKPYGVGYVELEGQVRVETRLKESDPEKTAKSLKIFIILIMLSLSPLESLIPTILSGYLYKSFSIILRSILTLDI